MTGEPVLHHIGEKIDVFANDESAVTVIEYAMIAGAVTLAIMTALSVMGDQMDSTYNQIKGYFDTVLG